MVSESVQDQFEIFSKNHAEVSWDNALDSAVDQIKSLGNLENPAGKAALGLILDELKLIQLETEQTRNDGRAPFFDQEIGQMRGSKIVLYYDLPWEGRGLSEIIAR